MSTILTFFGLFRKSLNVLIVRALSALLFVAVAAVDFSTSALALVGFLIRLFLLICRSVRVLILKNVLNFCKKFLDFFSL